MGAAYTAWKALPAWAIGLLAAACVLAAVAAMAPRWLGPSNRLWFALGELLGRIVRPLVLGLIFFLLITPVALIGRLLGRDALSMKRRTVATYWIARNPEGPQPESFRNRF